MTDSLQNKLDAFYMARALRLARRGWGRTSPNPMVGAVLVRDGHMVGSGWHSRPGGPHAEIEALQQAGERASGATLYVTLEPCSSYGRTPPCTEAVVAARPQRVVVGCQDPNPRHAGRGLQYLKQAGIDVAVGCRQEECAQLNEAFFCWIQEQRPFTILKMAMTLDGRIATAGGMSKWITGIKARAEVQKLRRWADAVMVGGETVRKDNPRLDVRMPANWPQSRQPLPIVYSRTRNFPRHYKIWDNPERPPEFISPATPSSWRQVMRQLGQRQITALLIEGGGELAATVIEAGVVDKMMLFIAPKILGGRDSRPVVGGFNPECLSQAKNLQQVKMKKIGDDFLVSGYLPRLPR